MASVAVRCQRDNVKDNRAVSKLDRANASDKAVTAPVHPVVMLRIAEALERIADSLEGKAHKHEGSTAFPWERTCVRTRNAISNYRMASYTPEKFRNVAWPWTCEDLMFIGHNQLKEARHFGPTSACEIAALLGELGFDNWLAT